MVDFVLFTGLVTAATAAMLIIAAGVLWVVLAVMFELQSRTGRDDDA